MRTLSRNRPTGLFRGGERFRLMTMLVMLGVLFMLMYRASDPYTWRWLAQNDAEPNPSGNSTELTGVKAPLAKESTPQAGEAAGDVAPLNAPPDFNDLLEGVPPAASSAAQPLDVDPSTIKRGAESNDSNNSPQPGANLLPESGSPQATTQAPGPSLVPAKEEASGDALPATEPIHPGPNQPTPRPKRSPTSDLPVERPGVTGPTDEDPEERAAALEQFQAISDGSTEIAPEEMPTYWRMFRWVENQSLPELTRRAKRDVVLNDFLQEPEVQRGQIVLLDLNVRQVIAYPAPENSAGIKTVYQIVGWTDQSKAWLYYGLTAHLPKGMPIGVNVHEKATMVGYFFKVQGYHPAGAGPNDKPLVAPLVIGRLTWKPSPLAKPPQDASSGWYWWVGAGVLLVIVAARWILPVVWPSRAKPPKRLDPAELNRSDEVRLDEWLSRAENGQLPSDPTKPDTLASDGHSSRYREN
jgi:hypothetical protein